MAAYRTSFQHPDCGIPTVATWACGRVTFRHYSDEYDASPETAAMLDEWCRKHARRGLTLKEAGAYLQSLGVPTWEAHDWEPKG